MHRRNFIKKTGKCLTGLFFTPSILNLSGGSGDMVTDLSTEVNVKQITRGFNQHWFGYYDKWQIDHTGRYALANRIQPLFRSPTIHDTVELGLIDLEDNNSWKTIGQSSAWGWQQGCMLQWLPGKTNEIIWNARLENTFVSIIKNTETGAKRILPKPIYTLSPDGKTGFGIDFARLQYFRPGYGYAVQNTLEPDPAPKNTGIYKIDLQTGHSDLIISYHDLSKLERPLGSVQNNFHWVNHLLVNPEGNRIIFLNRSRPYATPEEYRNATGKALDGPDELYVTRAITADMNGQNIYALNDSGNFSHFIWKGQDTICAWAKPEKIDAAAFYLFKDLSKDYRVIGKEVMIRNGHNTYVPKTDYKWILNDTYPIGKARKQELYLYHVPTKRKVILGKFHQPQFYRGEWRCDLHPRCNQQGTKVYFDSTHNGGMRQIYEIDISKVIDR